MVHPSQEILRKEKLLQNEVQHIARANLKQICDRAIDKRRRVQGIKFLAKWKIILGCTLLSLGLCKLHPQGFPAMMTDRKANPERGCNVNLFTGYVGYTYLAWQRIARTC